MEKEEKAGKEIDGKVGNNEQEDGVSGVAEVSRAVQRSVGSST